MGNTDGRVRQSYADLFFGQLDSSRPVLKVVKAGLLVPGGIDASPLDIEGQRVRRLLAENTGQI